MFRILFSIWFLFHPVHVTLTSIDYIPETNDFKGFVRLYLDDFLLDCQSFGCVVQQDDLISGDSEAIAALEKYLNSKLIIRVNDIVVKGRIGEVKVKLTDNELDIDIFFENEKHPETITVKSLIMTDLYKDQANMVIVKVNDFEQGMKLTPVLTEQTFKIKY